MPTCFPGVRPVFPQHSVSPAGASGCLVVVPPSASRQGSPLASDSKSQLPGARACFLNLSQLLLASRRLWGPRLWPQAAFPPATVGLGHADTVELRPQAEKLPGRDGRQRPSSPHCSETRVSHPHSPRDTGRATHFPQEEAPPAAGAGT